MIIAIVVGLCVMAALMIVGVGDYIYKIGEPRKPITHGEAVYATFMGLSAALILIAASIQILR